MKPFLLSLLIACFAPISIHAQSLFHYDTIPNPTEKTQSVPYNNTPRETSVDSYAREIPESNSGFDSRKLVLGGSFGLVFGDYTTINISPQVGYAFNRFITAGSGVSYNYYHYSNNYYNNNATYNYLGLNVYGRLNPIKYIALQVQPEIYGLWGSAYHEPIASQTVPCLLLGGGITAPAGRGGVSMMFYYDVIQDYWSPYGNQVFYSVGYTFNF